MGVILAMALGGLRLRRGGSPTGAAYDADAQLLARLRGGEEQAFVALAERHHASMMRIARTYVSSDAVAEEVVQDTWLAVLCGMTRFEERSSFQTWLLAILVNRARSTGVRERRSVAIGDAGPAVDASRFDASGAWMSPPRHWVEESDSRLLAQGASARIQATLRELPERQREVVMMRDVAELTAHEVCEALEISEANQRVLLHRGRSRLRTALEAELGRA
jgi:RNA polymerase sigma-70 factor, ECF subfamily